MKTPLFQSLPNLIPFTISGDQPQSWFSGHIFIFILFTSTCIHQGHNVPLVSLIFLKRSLFFPIPLFSSISWHWSLRKAFLSLLAILWDCVFKWVYLSFSPLLFASHLFTAICKVSSDSHFAFFAFLFLEDGLDPCLLYSVTNLPLCRSWAACGQGIGSSRNSWIPVVKLERLRVCMHESTRHLYFFRKQFIGRTGNTERRKT